jgi:hypothetical protein
VGDAGPEHLQEYSSFDDAPEILAQITALSDDPEFFALLAAWPTLPNAVRVEIARLVAAAADASKSVE